MATMSPALAASPIVRFTPDELAYTSGDPIPRDASGKPLPWVWEYLTETQRRQLEQERKEADR